MTRGGFPIRSRGSCATALLLAGALTVVEPLALADPPARAAETEFQKDVGGGAREDDVAGGTSVPEPPPEVRPFRDKPGYAQFFATTYFGSGVRFNNPSRLATPVGTSAEGLSITAPYVDIGLAATFGHPLGIQHGGTLRATVALQGIGQVVLTPSYLAWRRYRSLALYGRAGVPIVATPDLTWGLEAGVGCAWFVLGGIGVAAEMVGDVFYGAGTLERATVTYPVLSGQLGLVIAYEVFP